MSGKRWKTWKSQGIQRAQDNFSHIIIGNSAFFILKHTLGTSKLQNCHVKRRSDIFQECPENLEKSVNNISAKFGRA